MNIHQARYERFINSRKNRSLPSNTKTEKHHILPKSLGGTDAPSNLIVLSVREHYIAHLILWKAYGGKMSVAFHNMINFQRYKVYMTSRQYTELREDFLKRNSGTTHPMYGRTHTASARKKISQAHKGRVSPNKGNVYSKDSRDKISKSLEGNQNLLGHKHSEESKRKISESEMGSNNHFYNKTHSEEAKKKISDYAKNRPQKTKDLLKQARRDKSDKIICTPHGQFPSIADAVDGLNAIYGEGYVDRNFIFTTCISKNENIIHHLSQSRRPDLLPLISVGVQTYRDLGFGTIKK